MTKDTSFVLVFSISFLSVKYSNQTFYPSTPWQHFQSSGSTCQVQTLNLKIPHLLHTAPEGPANPTRSCCFLANTAVFQTKATLCVSLCLREIPGHSLFPQLLVFMADQLTFKVMISSPGGPEVVSLGVGVGGQRTSHVINSLTEGAAKWGDYGLGWGLDSPVVAFSSGTMP